MWSKSEVKNHGREGQNWRCTTIIRKLPITELKWDARTLTDIPGNTAYWFFVFFWQLSIRPLIGVDNVKPMSGRFK
jgi:hypothetical protein